MPTNSRQSKYSLHEFCLALKAVRERKGITLDDISTTTKIPSSMFVALERGDLSHWPKGLFGREFFRAYAGMLGIREDQACKEFVRLFPNDDRIELPVASAAGEGAPAVPAISKPRSMLDTIARMFKRPHAAAAEPEETRQNSEWTTDAHRVGPPASTRMRVRIKVS